MWCYTSPMSEFSDLYNVHGELVRTNVPREEAEAFRHVGPYMGIVVAVITNDNNEILYHKRHPGKSFEPNMYDHVCGGIKSGQTPEEAALDEAFDEVGVHPTELTLVGQGVNPYGFYCFRFWGRSNERPSFDPNKGEVVFAGYASLNTLRQMERDGEEFVDDFFPDIELAGIQE